MTDETSMVERVARALCKAAGHTHPDEDWTLYTDGVMNQVRADVALGDKHQRWHIYERSARAAIEAMREPTEAMLEAADYQDTVSDDGRPWPGEARYVWPAMIDAALK